MTENRFGYTASPTAETPQAEVKAEVPMDEVSDDFRELKMYAKDLKDRRTG
jgi:hypothetical protein